MCILVSSTRIFAEKHLYWTTFINEATLYTIIVINPTFSLSHSIDERGITYKTNMGNVLIIMITANFAMNLLTIFIGAINAFASFVSQKWNWYWNTYKTEIRRKMLVQRFGKENL